MSKQTATSATPAHHQTQSVTQAFPAAPRAADTPEALTAPTLPPSTYNDERRSVIEVTEPPPVSSTSITGNQAPGEQRPLPPFQPPASYGQPRDAARPHGQGPEQPLQPYYGQQHAWPQLMDKCPRCGFVAGQPLYAPPPQQHHQHHQHQHSPLQQQMPPGYPMPTYPQPHRAPQTYNDYSARGGPPQPNHVNGHLYAGNAIPYSPAPSEPQPPRATEISPTNPPLPRELTSFVGYGVAAATVPMEEAIVQADGSIQYRKRRESKAVKHRRLTRDERRDILLMRRLGYSYDVIARFLGTTISAVAYTCRQGTPDTKHHNAGRKGHHLPQETTDKIVKYVEGYLAKERAGGFDKKTGKKKMTPLTYAMIRDTFFKDEKGEIPPELKITDNALKGILNKKGLWLRTPLNQTQIEERRLRGKQQWLDKYAKDAAEKARAEAAARGQTITEDELAAAREHGAREGQQSRGYAEAGAEAEAAAEDEDEEMQETYSGTESVPDEDEDTEQGQDMEMQLRRAIQKHPLQNT